MVVHCMRAHLVELLDVTYKGYYDSHYPEENDLIYKQIEAISNLYGRDIEVYTRANGVVPKHA